MRVRRKGKERFNEWKRAGRREVSDQSNDVSSRDRYDWGSSVNEEGTKVQMLLCW